MSYSYYNLPSGLYRAERLRGGVYIIAKLNDNDVFEPVRTYRVTAEDLPN